MKISENNGKQQKDMKSNIEQAKEFADAQIEKLMKRYPAMSPGYSLSDDVRTSIFTAFLNGWEGYRASADYLNRPAVPLTEKPFLTLEEAALYIGISKSSMYKLTHGKEIPYTRPTGRKVFFDRNDLDTWLRSNKKVVYQPA